MVVRVSTHSYSPLSFHPGVPGRKLPLLTTAAGRAYFSFAPDNERQVLLEILRAMDCEDARMARDEAVIGNLVRETRRQGYGLNRGEWRAKLKFGGIAVPLLHRGQLVACINVVFLNSAVPKGEAEHRLAARLRLTANEIEAKFEAEHLALSGGR
jgi:IclR family mhp operon transcriptional activator